LLNPAPNRSKSDVGLEYFYTDKTQSYGALIHFGADPVTKDIPDWFHRYNARQIIETGIKKGKNIFPMHHLKVRSTPSIFLQEQFAVFIAILCVGPPVV